MEAVTVPRSITTARELLRKGEISVVELTRASLASARRLQPMLNAFITITEEHALAHAAKLDAELAAGIDRGPLHGIPIVHKDCFDTAGIRTTRGTRFFSEHVPSKDAAVVERLRESGCVMIGKANMKELASGGTGDNEFSGAVYNPWNVARSTGGSSSGTAAALAAGICLGGTGTDSGGSIRAPASWSGIVGVRPTTGLVSKAGCFPRSYSFDCAGPMTRTVLDAATLLTALAGHDPDDPSTVKRPLEDYAHQCGRDLRGVRLGIIEDYTFADIDADVERAVRDAVTILENLGAQIVHVEMPVVTRQFEYRALFNILQYEFHKILGPLYYSCRNPSEFFGRFVRANMERGSRISDEDYQRAQAERATATTQLRSCFNQVDALLTPCQPIVAQPIDAPDAVHDRCRQFMMPFSFAGLPAISIPCGYDRDELPIGLQIVCDVFQESAMFRIASAFEAATAHHLREPEPIRSSG